MSLLHILHKLHSPPALVSLLVLGGVTGYLAPHFSHSLHWVLLAYELLLGMVILPFIIAAVTLSLRRLFHMSSAGRVTLRIAVLVPFIVVLISLIGVGVGVVTGPGRNLSQESLVAFSQMVMSKATGDTLEHEIEFFTAEEEKSALGDHKILERIIPTNFFDALQDGEVLKIIVFCALLGIAIGVTHGKVDDLLSKSLEGIYAASSQLIGWITHAIPIMAFIAVATSVSKVGPAAILATFKFILIFSVSALALSAIFSLIVIIHGRVTVRDFARAMTPPLLQAVTTQSVVSSVPQTIEAMVDKLRFEPKLVELVIPLCATLLRSGPALYFGIATMFIAQMYDVHIGLTEIILITLGASLAAFSSAGAQGAVIISFGVIACEFVHLPFEAAMIFFIAIDEIVDAPRTILNLTAGAACAALLAGADDGEREPEIIDFEASMLSYKGIKQAKYATE
jgi:Na+/H+-dicarboxylate symporter